MFRPKPIPPGAGQESAWDYPRPAIAEPTSAVLRVEFGGRVIAKTSDGVRTLETSHPPTYYFPAGDVDTSVMRPAARRSLCEWKGQARYFDVVIGDRVAREACWSYLSPTPSFRLIAGHVAFYPGQMDACHVDGEPVTPQPGGFYGGWVTAHVVGPFKGGPGSMGW